MAVGYADSASAAPAANGNARPSRVPDASGLPKRQRLERLFQQVWDPMLVMRPQWDTLGLYVQPDRPMWCADDTAAPRFTERIFDNEASLALRDLGAVMVSRLSNPTVPWFELTTLDHSADSGMPVKRWLMDTRDRLLMAMDRGNFYTEAETVYQDEALFGTAAMVIEADPETIIRCEALPIGSFALAQDGRRRPDHLAREYKMTASQMETEFGAENLSEPVRQALSGIRGQTSFTVRSLIYPNPNWTPGAEDPSKRRFSECFWEKGGPTEAPFLREGGYHEFPTPCPRWGPLTPGTPYGMRSPGMLCLGDIKLLQAWEKATLNAWQKIVSPPLVSGPGFKNKTVYSQPGSVNIDDAPGSTDATLKPAYQINPNLVASEAKADQVRRRIARAFYNNLVAPVLTDQRNERATAAEIYQMRDEQFSLLGSVVERNADDFHDPAIARIFGIMWRAGEIPPPPPELQGKPLRVRLISSMAVAQKHVGVEALERDALALVQLATAAPTLAPVLHTRDWDAWSRAIAEARGVPPKVVRDAKETAALRAMQQQAAAQQAQMEQMTQAAGAARDLGNVDMTKDSALTRLVGQG